MGWIDKDKGGYSHRGTGWDGERKIKEDRDKDDGMVWMNDKDVWIV